MLVKRSGATHAGHRHHAVPPRLALRFGAAAAFDPREPGLQERIMEMTGGRGADAVIVAASAPGIVEQAVRYSRPGSRILLVRANLPPGADRSFRRRCLRGRAHDLRILQRLGGPAEGIRGPGVQRRFAG